MVPSFQHLPTIYNSQDGIRGQFLPYWPMKSTLLSSNFCSALEDSGPSLKSLFLHFGDCHSTSDYGSLLFHEILWSQFNFVASGLLPVQHVIEAGLYEDELIFFIPGIYVLLDWFHFYTIADKFHTSEQITFCSSWFTSSYNATLFSIISADSHMHVTADSR